MIPIKLYLIKSMYCWCIEYNFTPYVLIDTKYPGIIVPEGYIDEKDEILLNISTKAVMNLRFNHYSVIYCEATFRGLIYDIVIPCRAIIEIYAQENSCGLYTNKLNNSFFIKDNNEYQSDDDSLNGKNIINFFD